MQKEQGKQDTSLKHHIEGVMFAGVVTEMATNEELTSMVERIYYETFGMTPTERKLQKDNGEVEEIDWSYYDTLDFPYFIRQSVIPNVNNLLRYIYECSP